MITIVILIILATVTINAVFGDSGLIEQAQQAKDYSSNSTESDLEGINKLYDEYANVMAEDSEIPIFKSEIQQAKESGEVFEDTIKLKDDLDNDVTIPGEFHVAEDSGTKVEEGIVIEDDEGNQFVWIPVGKYQTTAGEKINNLSRRVFTETGATEITADNGDGAIQGDGGDYYGEGNENSVAKEQIDEFKTSVRTHGGFYIGRYEAGTEVARASKEDALTTPLVQANKNAYVYVTRDQAKTQAEAMYSGNSYVTSELISSYAWDTVLNFICQTNEEEYLLATTTDSTYGNIGTGIKELTGIYEADNYSNIHDILGNCWEWTTEYSEELAVGRAGNYTNSSGYSAASRGRNGERFSDSIGSFRLQLYIK